MASVQHTIIDPASEPFEELLEQALELDRAGKALGVNAFDNNFIREITICRMVGLRWYSGRGEVDALGPGNEQYELKSTDIRRGPVPAWPTSREVTRTVLRAFRSMDHFCFAVFDGVELLALYRADPRDLEPFLRTLDKKLRTREALGKNLNNPKFPWRVVRPVAKVLHLDARFVEPPYSIGAA